MPKENNQLDLFIDRILRIDQITEHLLHIYNRLYNNRNPDFTTEYHSVLRTEYNECFPKPDGVYDRHQLMILESKILEETLFFLGRVKNCELLTNPADILLAANESYRSVVEASPFDTEVTKFLAECVEGASYFEDICGIEYYHPNAGINGESAIFSISERKETSCLVVDFIFGDFSYQLSRTDGKPIKNQIPDSGIPIMENLLEELKPWADRMFEYKIR